MGDDETFHVEMDSHSDDSLTVSLQGELDIDDAAWVEATLAAAAEHHGKLSVDLSGLEFIDSAGLRSLITLKQRATILNIDVGFENFSPAVSRALNAAGLQTTLE